ncbi:MAG: LPS assembly protein LptD [Desulfobulbaceae bacterium]|jgi:LPS-assembly protein|nr:LPS assembly protein LptD [Desulfobulbaceae bacterium]
MPQRNVPRSKTFFLISLLVACLWPLSLFAANTATEEWNITADKITHFEHPKRIVAEGNIILEKRELRQPPKSVDAAQEAADDWADILGESEGSKPLKVSPPAQDVVQEAKPTMEVTTVIKADWISYDVERKYIEAKGNVSIVGADDTLKAESGTVNLESETGRFANAIITTKEKSLHLEGQSVAKTGYNTYHIEKGWIITCKVPDGQTPPWSLVSSSADIEQGGYAKLKHARFNVAGVPIFYTPYMVIPVKDTRQTGFLFPEFSYSDNSGFGLGLPFFINLSHSADMTIFPEYLTERGVKPGLEFRYAMSDTNKGVFFGQFLKDELSDPSETEYYHDTGYTHTNDERYWIYGKADAEVGNGWQVRMDVDIASDMDYLDEFDGGYTGYDAAEKRMLNIFGRGFDNETSPYRDNTLAASKYWSGMSLTATLAAQNDLVEDRPDTSASPLWRLPSLEFNGALPFYSTGMSLNWDADYVNYWREDGIGASRLDLHPSVSMPVPLSQYLESSLELGVRDTYYNVQEYGDFTWEHDASQNRLMADAEFEVASTLMREFDTTAFGGTALEHQIRPYVRYNYIPDVDQDELPRLDAVDRINEESLISYGIENFFNTIQTATSTREYATFRLFQSYSLLDEDTDRPFRDVGARMTWTPAPRTTFEYDVYYDVYDNIFSSHNVDGTYTTARGDIFSLDYSYYDTATTDFKSRLSYLEEYKTSDTIEQINALVRAHITDRWLGHFEIEHSISSDTTQTLKVGLIYDAPCWSVEVQSRYTEADTRFFLIFNLANIGSDMNLQL